MKIVALIPAYNPDEKLLTLVGDLLQKEFEFIVVVNDGSMDECYSIFIKLKDIDKVHVIQHAVNLGKGLALKTGMNYIYTEVPDALGIVTIDADGQHLPSDAEHVAQELLKTPESLILGVRLFTDDVPLRSRIGNKLTKVIYKSLVGTKLTDTQTGLRGIPRSFMPNLVKLSSSGYEFELDMLLACKYTSRLIREVPIETIYSEGNKSSHFNPLLDSMKIYFVLFRFLLASIITSVIDYSVFYSMYSSGISIIASQSAARLVAMLFNYTAVKKIVFLSHRKNAEALPRYVMLVVLSGTVSYLMITVLTSLIDVPVIAAKACAEGLIFLANFAIQRDFIFTKKPGYYSTDWNKYYEKPYKTASISRKLTESILIGLFKRHTQPNEPLRIAELGGANSCFLDSINRNIRPKEYHVFDNNLLGMEQLKSRNGINNVLYLHLQDVLTLSTDYDYDLVFSVGLIEHFSRENTRLAVQSHFKLLKPGGVAIISFPTPTLLYKCARWVAELTNTWIFHDERPLSRDEVIAAINDQGNIVFEKIIWPILFTQRIMVIQKRL